MEGRLKFGIDFLDLVEIGLTLVVHVTELYLILIEVVIDFAPQFLKLLGPQVLHPFFSRISVIEALLVESFFEFLKQDEVVLHKVVAEHKFRTSVQDLPYFQELFCVISQEVNLILSLFK